jgi:hypothetical protein
VEHRSRHPNRVTFSNPSVALAHCPAPHSSFGLASYGRAYWHRASIARPLNHHPATEAGAAPFARWLHKSGSNSNQAADLSERSTALSFEVVVLSLKSTSQWLPDTVDTRLTILTERAEQLSPTLVRLLRFDANEIEAWLQEIVVFALHSGMRRGKINAMPPSRRDRSVQRQLPSPGGIARCPHPHKDLYYPKRK